MKILIIGGEGRLGRPVVEHLDAAGHKVRVVSRHPTSRPSWLPETAEYVAGDATDTTSIVAAAQGCDAVHITVSGAAELDAVVSATAAATANRMAVISYVSGSATFPANERYPVIATKLAAERAIEACGVPSIVLCPSFSMDVLPMHIQHGLAAYFGKQPHPFHWLAASDFGRLVTAAYDSPDSRGERLFIRGPEAISMRETLRRYAEWLDLRLSRPVSLPFWAAKRLARITRDHEMAIAVDVYEMYEGVGGDGGDPERALDLLGPATTTLHDWLTTPASPGWGGNRGIAGSDR